MAPKGYYGPNFPQHSVAREKKRKWRKIVRQTGEEPASSDSVKAGWKHFYSLLSGLPYLSFLLPAQIYLHLMATNML